LNAFSAPRGFFMELNNSHDRFRFLRFGESKTNYEFICSDNKKSGCQFRIFFAKQGRRQYI
jgi:hypothetical protein